MLYVMKFSKKEAIWFGWEKTKANLRFFIKVMIIVALIYLVPGLFKEKGIITVVASLIFWALQIIVDLGLIKISLRMHDGEKAAVSDLFSTSELVLKYLAASILYGVIIAAGFLLLVIPGIIFAIKLQFYSYFIVDKNSGPIEALKKSWAVTRGANWNLYLFALLQSGVTLLGLLALLVGLLVAVPVTSLANAYVYRKLSSRVKSAKETA